MNSHVIIYYTRNTNDDTNGKNFQQVGCSELVISVGDWDAHGWKRIIAKSGRLAHFAAEFLIKEPEIAVYPSEIAPFADFEMHFVLTCFAIRRLAEKRLISDDLQERKFPFKTYPAIKEEFRKPFLRSSSNHFYSNYESNNLESLKISVRQFANEVIHSSHLGLSDGDEWFEPGILVASDYNLGRRLILIPLDDWANICVTVRDDVIAAFQDTLDPNTGEITAKRLSPGQLRD